MLVTQQATAQNRQIDEIPVFSAPTDAPTVATDASAPLAQEGSSSSANGQENSSLEHPADGRPISSASEGASHTGSRADVTLGGYAEVFWQYNFNRPVDGMTASRAFDSVHNSFTISNLVLDAQWNWQRVTGRIALQMGHTATLMYANEPRRAGSGISLAGPETWKWIQQAWIAYNAPIGRGLLCEAGIFLSPIGPEGMAIKDQWNWSRSNLFSALPYYHTGIRATYALSQSMALSVGGYNGWNSVVDNNDEKSLSLQWTYNRPDKLTLSVLYFTGVERDAAPTAPFRPWRHTFDSYVVWYPRRFISLMAHVNGGFEPVVPSNTALPDPGATQWWVGGALYARLRFESWLYLALRGDLLSEFVSNLPLNMQPPRTLFFPSPFVAEFTSTIDFRPHENLSLRIEYRHDVAGNRIYGMLDPTSTPTAPRSTTADYQNTLTFGATAWY